MFDTYRIQSGPSRVSVHKTVEEKRAPTDESVRLLREMERSARDEVIKSIKVANTEIEVVLHKKRDHLSAVINYLCVFKLNGQKRTAEFHANEWDDTEKRAIGIRDAIAKEVANAIMLEVAKSVRDLD